MNIYEVIHLVTDEKNIPQLDKSFQSWAFNTSVLSQEVREEIKTHAVKIAQMGELKVYDHIKRTYGIKI